MNPASSGDPVEHREMTLAEIRDMTRAALVAKVDGEARANQAKALLGAVFDVMREAGVKRFEITDPDDDAPLGDIAMTAGATSAVIVDPDKFLAWVTENRPEEIVTVELVRPSFQAALLDEIKKRGKVADRDDNEIPGVALVTGDPHLTTTPTRLARARARERAAPSPDA